MAINLQGEAALALQSEWRWCNKCQGLFYGPLVGDSRCPAGGAHAALAQSGSANYSLHMAEDPSRQSEWRWCHKCQGLFYGPLVDGSWCPAGGAHATPAQTGSPTYSLLTVGGVKIFPENNVEVSREYIPTEVGQTPSQGIEEKVRAWLITPEFIQDLSPINGQPISENFAALNREKARLRVRDHSFLGTFGTILDKLDAVYGHLGRHEFDVANQALLEIPFPSPIPDLTLLLSNIETAFAKDDLPYVITLQRHFIQPSVSRRFRCDR